MSAGRGWAYVGAGLGGAVSIAANVAHSYVPPLGAPDGWTPQGGAVVGAIFWPVALFVAVEILARVAWPAGRRWAVLRFGGLLPVAGVAAFVSYRHLAGLLSFYGEDGLTAVLGPLAVDGLMVMATGALLATGRVRPASLPEPVATPIAVAVPEPVRVVIPEPAQPVMVAVPEPIAVAVPLPTEPEPAAMAASEPAETIGDRPRIAVLRPRRHAATLNIRPRRLRGRPPAPARGLSLATEPATPARTRRGDAARRVAEALAAAPDAPVAELARLAGVSRSTVRRCRPEPVAA